MTRAVLLTFLTLCSARVSLVRAGAPPQATCANGETTVTKLGSSGALRIHCPNNFRLAPRAGNDAGQMQVYATAVAENPVNIRDVLPGASYLSVQNVPTLTVPQLPAKATSVFFHCQQQPDNQCFIQVEVAPAPRLGPNTCAALQSTIAFEVQQANETAVFSCGEGLAVFPQGSKALDEACSKEQALPSGAALAPKDGGLHLGFPQLPQQAMKICYICTNGGVQAEAAQRCEVRISVAANPDGSVPGANGAASLGAAARSASALGLALVAGAFLHFC
uniref:Merozoite surface antigen SAG1 n=1 Tax=Sarcocystis neurona TaxID=42890 RepID=Q95NZ4_SARNE|nr:surface antigen 1 [Sarcocystis neurona]AAK77909.1 merozoite surface antigen SAG1 [Sarcocystis neurona]AAK94921.1 merozoite surface antigen SAG1 [Sarcocystis neurona]AAO85714.1 putative surface antigen protein 1 [Sarcocystis neurona]